MAAGSRLLLDTHVVLWWLAGDPNLSEDVNTMIDDEIEVYVSAATVWEVAIKQSLGKLKSVVDLAEAIDHSDLRPLPISFAHAIEVGRLPMHHRDPFDRMIITQARMSGLTLVTRDPAMDDYDVEVLPA